MITNSTFRLKEDISTLLERGHFYFALTAIINESIKIARRANPPRACGKVLNDNSLKLNKFLSDLFLIKSRIDKKLQLFENNV
jgi:hypothetical protein